MGGILILWNQEKLYIKVMGSTEQEVHLNLSWMLSAIYTSVNFEERLKIWENLRMVVASSKLPWVELGDFNDVICQEEKKKANPLI